VPSANLNVVLRHLRRLRGAGPEDGDGRLLQRFVALRDEAAFAELLGRHGSMVLAACRRVLGDGPDAEDAFQATFLVLVQKASGLRDAGTLASWLYGVAVRVARKARTSEARRRARERQAIPMRPPDELEAAIGRDLRPVLDKELERLPEKYRAPLVLCYLEGHTQEEAARKLGWSNGTVRGRLARAREMLRKRLVRRGLAPTAAALTAVLSKEATAAVPVALFDTTLKTALGCAARTGTVAAPVAALTKGALNAMLWSKCKAALLVVVTLGVLVAGAGGMVHQALTARPAEEKAEPVAPKEKETPDHCDFLGDPLPPGALARLGTNRLRNDHPFYVVAFADGGKTLVAAGEGRKIRFWDATTGRDVGPAEDLDEKITGWTCIAVSPDGKTLALGGAGSDRPDADLENQKVFPPVIFLIDARTRKEIRRLEGNAIELAFSPDGKLLAASTGEACQLWEVSTGKRLHRIGEKTGVWTLAFSPDGKTLAGEGRRDRIVRFWETDTGKEIGQLPEQENVVAALAFSPDGKTLAVGTFANRERKPASPGDVQLWDVASRKPTVQVKSHHSVQSLAFSHDGKTLAVSGIERNHFRDSVCLWDVDAGKQKDVFDLAVGEARGVAFSPDDKIVAVAAGHHVRLWDVVTGKEPDRFSGHRDGANLLAYTPDGRTVATAGGPGDPTVLLWEASTGKPLRSLKGHKRGILTLAYDQDGSTLAVAGYGDDPKREGKFGEFAIQLVDPATGKELRRINDLPRTEFPAAFSPDAFPRAEFPVAFSPDGDFMAFLEREQFDPCIYSRKTGKVIHYLEDSGQSWSKLSFAPDGKTLAGASLFGPVRLWDVGTGRVLYNSERETHLFPLRWFVSGTEGPALLVFTKGEKKLLYLWDTATGKVLRKITYGGPEASPKAVSADGRMFAALELELHKPPRLRLWDVTTGRSFAVCTGPEIWMGHPPGIDSWDWAVAFAPDGRSLAALTTSGTLQLWESATGEEIHRWKCPEKYGEVPLLVFGPDGRTLATKEHEAIVLWDVTGRAKPTGLPRLDLKREERESLWADLAGKDVKKAHAALWALVAAGDQGVPLLSEKLRPAAVDERRLARLIAEFDSDEFAGREAATAALEKLNVSAEPALRRALKEQPSVEVRRRIEALLEKAERWNIVAGRALQVLEQIGTPEARKVLEALAKGDPDTHLVREARASLERLKKRP
jgi:RNA polymerase sigma factor (sigma-70 family)